MPSPDVAAYLQRINDNAKQLIDCVLDQRTEVSESNANILRQVGNRFYEQGKDQLAICKLVYIKQISRNVQNRPSDTQKRFVSRAKSAKSLLRLSLIEQLHLFASTIKSSAH